MSIRLDLAQTQSLRVADSDATTFPGGEGSLVCWILVLDGQTSGAGIQYVFSSGAYNALGSLNISYVTSATASANGQIVVYPSNATSTGYGSTNRFTSGAYLFDLAIIGGNLVLRSCPILSTAPADGSAVSVEFSVPVATAKTDVPLNGTNGLIFGCRQDNTRYLSNSLARLFRNDGVSLTDLQVAQLAYGMEITELGYQPAWYFRLNDNADMTDRGQLKLAMSAIRSPATGTAPAFGYDSSNPPSNTAPVITGAPSISGTPTAGQAVAYTPAAASAIPAAVRTQQWSIDGADVAGATGATYTPAAGDAGKALRVRQVATNSVGSASSTSAAVTVTAAIANSIDIAALPAERIYPRVGTSATINLSGTYAGDAPASIEYQLYAEDGATVLRAWGPVTSPTIGAGKWSASQSIPQGGMYRIAVRANAASGAVLGMSEIKPELFGVGAMFGVIGSSGSQLLFHTTSSDAEVEPRADVRVNTSNAWAKFETKCAAIILANGLAERLGVPVALFNYGVSGSGLAGWAATNSGMLNALKNAVNANGGRLEGCYITAGSNDAAADGNVTSVDSHLALMRALVANTRANSAQPDLPICWVGINRRTSNESRIAQFNWARAAENINGDDANVTQVQSLDYDLRDGVHLSGGSTGYPALMQRVLYQWGERLTSGTYLRGPKIVSLVADGNDVIVTLQHRGSSDITPTSGITGFTAGTTINSVSRIAADKIRIACAAPPSTVGFLAHPAPAIGTPVYGNTATKLPLQSESQMAIQQEEVDAPDTTAPTMSGTISITNVTTSGATLSFQAATDNIGVTGYEYSTNGGTSYVNAGMSRSLSVTGLASSTTYAVRARAYDAAGNRSAPLSASFSTLAEQPPVQSDIDASKVSASRKVVFPGGTRVVVFGSQPGAVVPNAPYFEGGKWWSDKHPEDERYYVADVGIDLADRRTTAESVTVIVAGVIKLEDAVIQGSLIPVKLGSLSTATGAANFCTFRVTCANGERFDRTIWFRAQQGQWPLAKDPDDQSFYVFDIGNDLADSGTTATSATAIPVGVTELAGAQVQGPLVAVKLGGMSTSADPTNYCKLRVDCANGERFYRTIHFTRVDN